MSNRANIRRHKSAEKSNIQDTAHEDMLHGRRTARYRAESRVR